MKKYVVIFLLLTGCSTPLTALKNSNGDVVTCGGGTAGSVAGGLIGYTIQEDHDKECVDTYKAKGYRVAN